MKKKKTIAPRQVRTVDLQISQLGNYETDALPTELVEPISCIDLKYN